MAKHLGIANTHSQRCTDLGESFSVSSVHVKSPGIGVEREQVVPPSVFRLGNLQSLCRELGMVGIVKNQFAVGVIRAETFEPRLSAKFSKGLLGLVFVAA